MENRSLYRKIIVNLFITILFTILAVIFVPRFIRVFFPFVLAFILSLIANPIVRFMERKIKIKRKHGSAIIIIFVLAAVIGLIYLLLLVIIKEVGRLIQDIPELAEQAAAMLDTLTLKLADVIAMLPEAIQNALSNLTADAEGILEQLFDGVEFPGWGEASSYLKIFGNIVFGVIVTILATYFMIAQRDQIGGVLNRVLPDSIRNGYAVVLSNFKTAVGGYFKAQFKIMLILDVVMYVVFLILGIDYAFLLVLAIGFIDLLPVFGTGIVFWPWAILDFINANYTRAIVILVLYLACQIIKQVLQPKLVGDSVGISPFLALVFMYIGFQISGLLGLILGLPIGMIVISFYRIGLFDRLIRGIKIIAHDMNEYRKY